MPALAGRRTYLTLDDLEILERSRREPDALVRIAKQVTLEEVQRSPELLLVKRAVDNRRASGRIILTGSANLSKSRPQAELGLQTPSLFVRFGSSTPK